MLIELQSIRPHPIPEKFIPESDVWATDLVIESGVKSLIAAQSGKGKSTLLHILYGLRNDFSGDALIDGHSVRKLTSSEWAIMRRTKTSILFQDLKLFPQLNARDNILLVPEENSSAPSVDEMLHEVGMEEFVEQPVETLSFGQRQRIALLRALRKPFELLLLDEPFSHLDEENTSAACGLIEQIVGLNKASLIISSLGDAPPISFDEKFRL
mgnify:CR=1 FL=1